MRTSTLNFLSPSNAAGRNLFSFPSFPSYLFSSHSYLFRGAAHELVLSLNRLRLRFRALVEETDLALDPRLLLIRLIPRP